jgi:tight adherence protein B
VLVALPFALTGILTFMNPEYMSPLFTTGTGHLLIMIGIGSMTIGSLMLKKIVSFKV